MGFLRPIYYLILAISFLGMVAKNNMTTETIVSTWNDETGSWEEISRTEEDSVHISNKTDWIYDDNNNCIRVDETWTYKPGSNEPEHEVWINGLPLNRTIRDGGHVLGRNAKYAWDFIL